jgi:hypothetical protein
MPIETTFSFHHHPGPAAPLVDPLGPLRGLAGTGQRTWRGHGFNMIWRPNHGQSGNKPFFLELNLTTETLTFTNITGTTGVANRGLLQDDIFFGAAAYLQTINDSFDNTGQHFEPGVWINVPQLTNPQEGATVARMGTIPHGTTINLQGGALVVPQPQFQPVSITPFRIGSPDDGHTGLVPFPEEMLATPSTSRTDLSRVASLDQAHLTNPNLFLSDAIAGQTITETVVLSVSSDTSAPGSLPPPPPPDAGGGTDNIAFLVGKGTPPTGGPNADAIRASAIFWIESVADPHQEAGLFLQLQYSQRVLLNFNGLSWPHVTVATLRAE